MFHSNTQGMRHTSLGPIILNEDSHKQKTSKYTSLLGSFSNYALLSKQKLTIAPNQESLQQKGVFLHNHFSDLN